MAVGGALEPIGIEAVASNVNNFISQLQAMEKAYNSTQAASDRFASSSKSALSSVSSALVTTTQHFSSFGVGVAAGLGAAIGSAAISGLRMAADAISGLGREALGAIGKFEMMGLAFSNMVARDLVQAAEARGATLSLTDARQQAIPVVQELLKWTQLTAIQSPFTQEGVAGTFRLAQSYGFAAAAAQGMAAGQEGITDAQKKGIMTAERLTQDIIDFTAGSGQSEAVAQRVALALGQIQARGKLAGQEVMQLTEAGISVDQILAKAFGKTRQEIVEMREKGLIPADQAIEAIAKSIEKDYGGAAKRATGTVDGLIASLGDIKEMGLRAVFEEAVMALKPLIGEFVDLISLDSEKAFAPLRNIGTIIGGIVTEIVTKVRELTTIFQTSGIGGLATALGSSLSSTFNTAINMVAQSLRDNWPIIQSTLLGWAGQFWTWLTGPGGALEQASGQIGVIVSIISAEISNQWPTIQATLLTWGQGFWTWLTGPGGVVETASAQVGVAIAAISAEIAAQWPSVRDALLTWGQGFWTWLTGPGGALEQLGANMNSFTQALLAWATGPGVPQLQSAGEEIGKAVVNGIKLMLGGEMAATEILTKFGASLASIVPAMAETWASIGASIGSGIAIGIIESITGTMLSEDFKAKIAAAFTGLTEGLNPLGPAARGVQEFSSELNKLSLPDWLRPGSPTPFEMGLRGIADTLKGPLAKAISEFGAAATPPFQQIADVVTGIKAMLVELSEETLMSVGAAASSAGASIAEDFGRAADEIGDLVDEVERLKDSVQEAGSAAQQISGAFSSFQEAGSNIRSYLIPALQDLVDWLNEVADAAGDAAGAVGQVGSASDGAGGPGFQAGANFVVPPGFGNDSFPFRAESGERVIVIPKGEAAAGPVVTVNVNTGDINNGMDAQALAYVIRREVMSALAP